MGKEVERWDPPNKEMPKYPIPLWGATSIKVKAPEAVGPIFPVSRENDFAANELKSDPLTQAKPEMGDKLVPYPCYPLQENKHGFTGVGTPQSPCDVGGQPKSQYGPTYGFSDGKNGYVPPKPRQEKLTPVMVGPVFQGVGTGTGKYAPMPLPKIDDFVMHGPVFPLADAGKSKYTPQPFGCSGSGLKVDRPKELCGPGNRDVGDRSSAMIEPGKYVPEIKEKPHGPVLMSGPKMPGIEADNKFNIVPPRVATASARMEMPGPVYPGVTAENKYCKVEEKVKGELLHPLPLHGPGVSAKNCYSPQEEKQPGQLVMAGPKFKGVDDQCKFTPAIKKADTESLLTMNGPKFRNIVDTSLYNESPPRAPSEGTRLMTGPIFPGIEAQNKYGPTEPELSPKEKIRYEKPFLAPNYPGVESKNCYNLDQIENGMPAPFRMDEGSIMVGPKYPGIQDSGYEYNPPSIRGTLPKVEIISAPVFVEDGANKYSVVPEKTHGELFHPLPLHGPGVESKNSYCPQEEKQPGQLVLAGPVFRGVDDQCKYTPQIRKADTESQLVMSGPKFRNIVDTSLYNESPMRAPSEGTRLMTAPIFPGIKAENSFGPASMGY